MSTRQKLFLASIIALMVNLRLYAQINETLDTLGIIEGYIRAQSGKPIENATIKIIGTDYTRFSGPFGYFKFDGLTIKIKMVQIEISKDGYFTDTEKVFITDPKYHNTRMLKHDIMLLSKNKKEYTRPAGTKITFSWRKNPEPDLAGYKIYRSNQSFIKNPNSYWRSPCVGLIGVLSSHEETKFTDVSPLMGDNFYVVTAFDTNGRESPYSSQIYYYIVPPSKFKYWACSGAVIFSTLILVILIL